MQFKNRKSHFSTLIFMEMLRWICYSVEFKLQSKVSAKLSNRAHNRRKHAFNPL